MNLSYWEHDIYFRNLDVVVVGSGIVGLHAAIRLKELDPALRVLVVEAGILPSGASTKNAGFACFGSMTELMADIRSQGEESVFDLVELRWKGLARLRRRLGDKNIGFQQSGGFEVFLSDDEHIWKACQDQMKYMNQELGGIVGRKTVFRRADKRSYGFGLEGVSHLIENTAEGQIHTGKMMQSLLSYARKLGVEILNGLTVSALESEAGGIEVQFTNGWRIQVAKVIVAVNGFANRLLPQLHVRPARNQVLVTSPIPGLTLKGTFHYNEGYVYFRNTDDGRVLLGGGRNLDTEGETTDQFGLTDQIQQYLEGFLQEVILPGKTYAIEQRWSGILGLGSEKKPIIQALTPHLIVAVRLGGMGVAIGSLTGERAAELFFET
ncbi:MAG: FAD-binding oxidoreductase [Bacteroidetes bacterium]|nr:MAG: FAD-binding oxidoreductase [Bacteroidota bacterium]